MIRAALLTNKGRVRDNNEDTPFLALRSQRSITGYAGTLGSSGILLAGVCDGMGGAAAGEVASQLAAKEVVSHFFDNGEVTRVCGSLTLVRESLAHALEAANERVRQHSRQDRRFHGMGTTCVAAAICSDIVYIANVGDSRAYLITGMLTGNELVQLTVDNTVVAELIAQKAITPEEALVHPYRNILTQVIGPSRYVRVATQPCKLDPGDTLLLCSDGLTNMVEDSQIREILTSCPDPEEACERLIQAANEAGGQDNISVVIIRQE